MIHSSLKSASLSLMIFAGLALSTNSARAEKFANQFAEFELPPNWSCQLEGAEWVCQSGDPAKKKEAIIVLAAKLKGDMDSLEQYLSHLTSVKTFTSAAGKPLKSEPKYAKNIVLNGQTWVDSLHLESEIAGFYTRYLATVKEDIGILVTYSISKVKYQEYLPEFETMVKTLRVFRREGGINVAGSEANLLTGGGNTTRRVVLDENSVFGDQKVDVKGGADGGEGRGRRARSEELQGYLLFGVAAVAGYFILKRKKK